MNWDKVHKDLAHIELPEHKEKMLLQEYEKIPFDFTGLRVFDYGCGGGYFAKWVTDNFDCDYLGYDISYRSLKAARAKNWKLKFIESIYDAENIDVIVCLACIQHMPLKQYEVFQLDCQVLQPKEIIVQYRYNHYVNETKDLIKRLSMPRVEIHGYKSIYESEVNKKNNYKYEILRDHTS